MGFQKLSNERSYKFSLILTLTEVISIRILRTLDYLINVHGRLLFSEKISRVDALIRWWTLINFLAKFQGGRLFHCGRLLIFEKLCVI